LAALEEGTVKDFGLRPYHCGISVSSIPEASEWFEKILGFEPAREADLPHLGFKIAFLKKGDFEIELFEHQRTVPASPDRGHPDTDNRTQGTKHLCFAVNDLEGMLEHCRANDVEIVLGPVHTAGLDVFFVHGPDQCLLEFAQA
jgi:methylmalonyl-CoA/ethylmalonyl-CoA epimerase